MDNIRDRRIIEFELQGTPVTQGSKNPVAPTYGDGTAVRRHREACPGSASKEAAHTWAAKPCKCPVMVNTVEDNAEELGAWRDTVGWTAKAAMRSQPLLDGLVIGVFEFIKPRPKSHYGTGRNAHLLKDSAPAAPGSRPDGIKLARAIEDALSKVVYTDDSRIVSHLIEKRYCDRLEPERVRIKIIECRAQTVSDLLSLGKIEMPSATEQFEQLGLLDELAEPVAA